MFRMTILYGMPTDPEHFKRYYYETHIPIARHMKGLTGWNLSWVQDDGETPPTYLLVAELYASSQAAMTAVLESPEGVAAREDVSNFATGSVQFLSGDEEQVVLA